MLDTHQFFENLNEIQNKIYNSFFLKEVDRANLSPNEKAQLDIKIFEIACNNALRLQELMQREKELEFSLYQKRVELEINVIRAKAEATKALSEAIISVIQAYVTKISVTDNANIQRANIYTQLMQIIANASNLNALSQSDKNGNNHISNAIDIISKIKDTEDVNLDSKLNKCIENLVNRSNEIMLLGAGSQDIFIYAVKKEIQTNETLELYGMHIFSNNECEFMLDNEIIKGRVMVFSKDKEGLYKIGFRAKNIQGTWIETHIYIVVKDNVISYDLPLIQA
ncbi:hypothetical protein [Helicobacter bilis]|uniref:hypothetical protein n=1 Tax=Helicobacter bilis TaxID=37372 RepID=UPI0020C2D287|nr:hypothetical protein [Helicobacter bilis]